MMTSSEMALPSLARLFQRLRSPRLIRFAVVGFSGVFVNLGLLAVFADVMHVDDRMAAAGLDLKKAFAGVLDMDDVLASAIAIELSIVWNFVLNNAWTFRDKNEGAAVGFSARLLRYNLVALIGMLIQLVTFVVLKTVIMSLLHLSDAGLWKYPSQLAGIAIAMGWNFLSNFFWTWAPSTPKTAAGPAPRAEVRPNEVENQS